MATYGVDQGRWTDFSKGSVLGDQITLSPHNTNLLVAAVAVLNTLIAGMVWSIVSFLLHQARTDARDHDGFYHQIQILLRNTESAWNFASSALSLGIAWRRVPGANAWARSLAWAAPTFALFIAFTAAGMFLSNIASRGDVLLSSDIGGYMDSAAIHNLPEREIFELANAQAHDRVGSVQLALSYAESCYALNGVSQLAQNNPIADCDYLVQPKLGWTTSSAPCPFGDMCLVPDDQVLRLDSGPMDSHTHFGMDSPPNERITVRRTTTCSPIKTQGFVDYNYTDGLGNNDSIAYMYGANAYAFPQGSATPSPSNNLTFLITRDLLRNLPDAYLLSQVSPHITRAIQHSNSPFSYSTASDWILTDDNYPTYNATGPFLASGGKNTLFLLASTVHYIDKPVEDPWFQATYHLEADNSYTSTEPKILACVDTAEICNPSNQRCAPIDDTMNLSTRTTTVYSPIPISLTPIQNNTAFALVDAFLGSTTGVVASMLGAAVLEAHSTMDTATPHYTQPVPRNQWHREVARIFAAGQAMMQRAIVLDFGGPASPVLARFVAPAPPGSPYALLQSRQKVRNDAYSSFSVLALACVLAVDVLVILGGLAVRVVLPHRQRARGRGNGYLRAHAYAADGALQMHRALLAQRGRGTWREGVFEEPVTHEWERFAGLSVEPGVGLHGFARQVDGSTVELVPRDDKVDAALPALRAVRSMSP